MDELIQKFFEGDLTEAEDQALSDRLSSSVEDALKFGAAAEAAYLSFGLPDPQWPGGGASTPPWHAPLGLKSLILLPAALAAGLAGWALWHYHFHVSAALPQALPLEKTAIPVKKAAPPVAPETIPLKKEIAKAPATPVVPVAPLRLSIAPMTPVLTPVDLTQNTRKTFSNLSVVVRRPSAGEVTVRVLKPDGSTAVLLYQGLLKAGKWGFDWDGKLADGQMAPPGYYQIQVQSGPLVQKKSILIR